MSQVSLGADPPFMWVVYLDEFTRAVRGSPTTCFNF